MCLQVMVFYYLLVLSSFNLLESLIEMLTRYILHSKGFCLAYKHHARKL
jgi:hypothetical protein